MTDPGKIVVLNGAPRSGKSSIVTEIQETFDGPWMNLGVDVFCRSVTPTRYQPGIGLRPGGERPDLEVLIPAFYESLYESIAAHCRKGLNVVADLDHHDAYSTPLRVLPSVARHMVGLPAFFVGVYCPLDVILKRREDTWGEVLNEAGLAPDPVIRWQEEVHRPGIYDLTVDTGSLSPAECAALIRARIEAGPQPTAFQKLADEGV